MWSKPELRMLSERRCGKHEAGVRQSGPEKTIEFSFEVQKTNKKMDDSSAAAIHGTRKQMITHVFISITCSQAIDNQSIAISWTWLTCERFRRCEMQDATCQRKE